MKNRQLYLSVALLIWGLLTLSASHLCAQPNTNYWFEGYVYGKATDKIEERAAYVPVLLSLATKPKNYIGIVVTDGAGFFSFKGTPIDIHQQYLITLFYGGGAKDEVYQCLRFDTNPSRRGAVYSDIKTSSIRKNLYTPIAIPLAKQKPETLLKTVLDKHPSLQIKKGVYFFKGKTGLPGVFINGIQYPIGVLSNKLQNITVDQVASARILRFKVANKFMPGVVDISLKEGESASPSVNRELGALRKK